MRSLVGELFWGGGTRVCLVGVELITFSDYDACDYSLFECHHSFGAFLCQKAFVPIVLITHTDGCRTLWGI